VIVRVTAEARRPRRNPDWREVRILNPKAFLDFVAHEAQQLTNEDAVLIHWRLPMHSRTR
jgi:hypothetical protein